MDSPTLLVFRPRLLRSAPAFKAASADAQRINQRPGALLSSPMPNPFLNSAASFPAAVGSAAATPCPQPRAAAAPIEVSADEILELQPAGTEVAASVRTAASDPTDCISEIFFYARKLMKQPPAFVLDEAAFMAAIDEEPLFLRSAV
jgi:hypothetical protein